MSEAQVHPAAAHGSSPDASGDALEVLNRVKPPALAVGGVACVLLLLGLLLDAQSFVRSYLYAYIFWVGVSLGCLALLMLQHLTGGGWGVAIRRILEGGTRLMPLLALLFVPVAASVLLGSDALYPWLGPDHQLGGFKGVYLSPRFFIIRAIGYFMIWSLLASLLNKWSLDQDRSPDPRLAGRMQAISGPGLILYALTVTFAAIDWVMSLDPHWYSTIYGFLFIIGQLLSTMALVIVLLGLLARRPPLAALMTRSLYNDLGNLLMAFVMLWAYISFSQFLIIWSANTAEEAPYYVLRTGGAWGGIALVLVGLHFFVPFMLLLWRKSKRDPRILSGIALGLLAMRFVDLFWLIQPSLTARGHGGDGHPAATAPLCVSWLDLPLMIVAVAAIGGIFIYAFIAQLGRRAIVPVGDPRLSELQAGGHHHG
jgi:hypothetical protein